MGVDAEVVTGGHDVASVDAEGAGPAAGPGERTKVTGAGREVCAGCGRALPLVQPPQPKKKRFTVAIPRGEEGLLDEMLDVLASRYTAAWGDSFPVGQNQERYRTLHYALTVALEQAPPAEHGG